MNGRTLRVVGWAGVASCLAALPLGGFELDARSALGLALVAVGQLLLCLWMASLLDREAEREAALRAVRIGLAGVADARLPAIAAPSGGRRQGRG